MPARSRRKTVPTATTSNFFSLDGEKITTCYCRRCMETKSPSHFLTATDTMLDRNGYMSICSECIDDLFDKIFATEHDVSKTILKLCRMLNVVFLEGAVQATIAHLTKEYDKNGKFEHVFGWYKSKVSSLSKINPVGTLTFSEPLIIVSDNPVQNEDDIEGMDYLKQFWGEGLELEDYIYLERELDDWKKTHKSTTKAEVTLLKELCFKELEIRKARATGQPVNDSLKQLQELMKTASVDPSKTNIANSGKSQDTFSSFIKIIEENEPADYYKDQKMFADYDNIGWYFEKYVTRPLKNFVTGSRDFDVSEESIDDEDDDLPVDNSIDLDGEETEIK